MRRSDDMFRCQYVQVKGENEWMFSFQPKRPKKLNLKNFVFKLKRRVENRHEDVLAFNSKTNFPSKNLMKRSKNKLINNWQF